METITVQQLLSDGAWAERLARRLADSRADAEELVQEGWVAAWLARPETREGIRPWLARVLRNAAANARRTEDRRREREVRAAGFAPQAAVPSPEDLVARVEIQRLLAELVLALEAPVREVVLLHYYQGLTSGDIARALGAPEGTVRWRLKVGVDELRQRLDERHGGSRTDWLRLIVPTTPRPRRARAAVYAALAGAIVVLLGVGYRAGRSNGLRASRLSDTTVGSGAGTPPSDPPTLAGRGTPQLVAAAGTADDLDGCAKRLADARSRIAALEPEYVGVARGRTLYEQGDPNPEAEATLRPVLARIMRGDASAAPDYSLDCRTWACAMKVLQPDGRTANAWMKPLQLDEEIRERTRGISFQSGPPVKDPVSGGTFVEQGIYLRLADPSAERIPLGPNPNLRPWRPVIPARRWPPSTSLAACRADLATATKRLASMRAAIERDTPMETRWREAPENGPLSKEMATSLHRLGLSDAAVVEISCRGQICRIRLSDVGKSEYSRLMQGEKARADPLLRRWEGGSFGGATNFVVLAPADFAAGMDIATRMAQELLAAPALAACDSEHKPSGRLLVQFQIPRSGEPNQDGEFGKVSIRIGGALAGTPFARCVEPVVAAVVAHNPVPPKTTGATLYKRLDFPRAASPQ